MPCVETLSCTVFPLAITMFIQFLNLLFPQKYNSAIYEQYTWSGSSGCRTSWAPLLSQQGLEGLLCPGSQASLMGKSCQLWLPLLQQKCAFELNFFFLLILPFCFAFSVSSFQLWFLWGILGSEVLIQSWWAGIHSYRKDSPIVSLLSSQDNFFNDLTIAHLHFCLCKITWSLTAAAWERALVLLKGIGQGWALC